MRPALLHAARRQAAALVGAAACDLTADMPAPVATAALTRGAGRGDVSSSFALAAAARLGMSPGALAALLADRLTLDGTFFCAARPTAGGHLYFTLGDRFYTAVLDAYAGAEPAACAPFDLLLFPPPHGVSAPAAHFYRCAGLAPDPALATRRDGANPLYRVAYAHARACALCARTVPDGGALDAPARALLRTLAEAPAPDDLRSIARHLIAVADRFFAFYHTEGVRTAAAQQVADAARIALAQGLGRLGLTLPPS